MTDYPDWQTPQAHANTIAKTGVGLLRFSNVMGSATAATLAGGGTKVPAINQDMTQPSFDLAIITYLPSGVGTVPFALFSLAWYDPTAQFQIAQDDFIVWSGNGMVGNAYTGAWGPAKGEIVLLTIQNLEPAQTLTYTYVLSQTSHVFERTYERVPLISSVAPIGYVMPSGDPARSILAYSSPTITPGATQTRLVGPYSGKWRISLDNTSGANACGFTVQDPTGYSQPANVNLYPRQTVAAGATVTFEFNAPMGPVTIGMTNNGGAGNIQPVLVVMSEQ